MKNLQEYIFEAGAKLVMPDYKLKETFEESDVEFSADTLKKLKDAFGVDATELYSYFADSEEDFRDEDKSVSKFNRFEKMISKLKEEDSWEDQESDCKITIYKTSSGQVIGMLEHPYGDFNNVISAQREVK